MMLEEKNLPTGGVSFDLRPRQREHLTFSEGSYSVMVITLDFESSDPGSNPGRT